MEVKTELIIAPEIEIDLGSSVVSPSIAEEFRVVPIDTSAQSLELFERREDLKLYLDDITSTSQVYDFGTLLDYAKGLESLDFDRAVVEHEYLFNTLVDTTKSLREDVSTLIEVDQNLAKLQLSKLFKLIETIDLIYGQQIVEQELDLLLSELKPIARRGGEFADNLREALNQDSPYASQLGIFETVVLDKEILSMRQAVMKEEADSITAETWKESTDSASEAYKALPERLRDEYAAAVVDVLEDELLFLLRYLEEDVSAFDISFGELYFVHGDIHGRYATFGDLIETWIEVSNSLRDKFKIALSDEMQTGMISKLADRLNEDLGESMGYDTMYEALEGEDPELLVNAKASYLGSAFVELDSE